MSILVADTSESIVVADALEGLNCVGRYVYLVSWLSSLRIPQDGLPSCRLNGLLEQLALNPLYDVHVTTNLISTTRREKHLPPLPHLQDLAPSNSEESCLPLKRFAAGHYRGTIEVAQDRQQCELELIALGAEKWSRALSPDEASLPRNNPENCCREKFALVKSLMHFAGPNAIIEAANELAEKCKRLSVLQARNSSSHKDTGEAAKKNLGPTPTMFWAYTLDSWSDSYAGTIYDVVLWIVVGHIMSNQCSSSGVWLEAGNPVREILNAFPKWRRFVERWPYQVEEDLSTILRAVRMDPILHGLSSVLEERAGWAHYDAMSAFVDRMPVADLESTFPCGVPLTTPPNSHQIKKAHMIRKSTATLGHLVEDVVQEVDEKRAVLRYRSDINELMYAITNGHQMFED